MVAWIKLDTIAQALVDAGNRGVTVRALVRAKDDCTWLRYKGVEARRHTRIHNKVVVFPDTILTGSANWTATSLSNDWKDILIIYNPEGREVYRILFDTAWGRVTGCGSD